MVAIELISLISLALLSLAINLVVVRLLWKSRPLPGAKSLILLEISTAIWTACATMELFNLDIPGHVFWSQAAYLGTVNTPPLFLTFALAYTSQDRWLTRKNLALLWLIPILSLVAVLTNSLHGWFYPAVIPNPNPSIPFPIFEHGPAFYLLTGYSYLLILTAAFLLARSALRLSYYQRRQLLVILVGVPIPFIANFLYVAGISPTPNWDLTPLAFSLSGLIFAVGITRYQLFDLIPLARDTVFDSLGDGLVVLDLQNRIIDINQAARSLAACQSKPTFGVSFDLVFPCLADAFGSSNGISEVQQASEPPQWLELRITDLTSQRGIKLGRLVAMRDITERKLVEERLERNARELARLAITDSLTGLYNRRYAEDIILVEFNQAERYGSPVCLAIFDIDLFKQVNDQHGHATGDLVLQEIAVIFRAELRAADIVARLGGDEFLVVMPQTHLDEGWRAIDRLRSRMAEKALDATGQPCTISGGVTCWQPGDTPDSAIRRGDRLLYQAKNNGRNAIIRDPVQEKTISNQDDLPASEDPGL